MPDNRMPSVHQSRGQILDPGSLPQQPPQTWGDAQEPRVSQSPIRRQSTPPATPTSPTSPTSPFSKGKTKAPVARGNSKEAIVDVTETGLAALDSTVGVVLAAVEGGGGGFVAAAVSTGVNLYRAGILGKEIRKHEKHVEALQDQVSKEAKQIREQIEDTPVLELQKQASATKPELHKQISNLSDKVPLTKTKVKPPKTERPTVIQIEEEPPGIRNNPEPTIPQRLSLSTPTTSSDAKIHSSKTLIREKSERLRIVGLSIGSAVSNTIGTSISIAGTAVGNSILATVSGGFSTVGAAFGTITAIIPMGKHVLGRIETRSHAKSKSLEDLPSYKHYTKAERGIFKNNDEVLLDKSKKGFFSSNKLNFSSFALNSTAAATSLAALAGASVGPVIALGMPIAGSVLNAAATANTIKNARQQNKVYEAIQNHHAREFNGQNLNTDNVERAIQKLLISGTSLKEEDLDYLFTLKNNESTAGNSHVDEYLLSRSKSKSKELSKSYLVANREHWEQYCESGDLTAFKAALAAMRSCRELLAVAPVERKAVAPVEHKAVVDPDGQV